MGGPEERDVRSLAGRPHSTFIVLSRYRPEGGVMLLKSTAFVSLVCPALLAVGCSSGWGGASPSSSALPLGGVRSSSAGGYHTLIDPSDFSTKVDNPWFPLTPGSRYIYIGVKDGEPL